MHRNNAKAGAAAQSTTANTAKQRTGMLCVRQVIVLCVAFYDSATSSSLWHEQHHHRQMPSASADCGANAMSMRTLPVITT
jgi:hypothetical protein